ncbi:MAG: hypothetical protein LUE96_07645 [Lachnospiraceae bacterium]|nr:hypothetical protein [Lachnospiraceae bacterium]
MNIYLLNGVCSGEQNDRLTYYSVKRGGTFGGYMQDFDEYLKLKNRERNLLLVIPQDEIMVSWFKGNGFVEFEDYMTEEY